MKFVNILYISFLLACVALLVCAEEEAPKKLGIQARRPGGRGLLRTTTTAAPAPPADEEEQDENTDEDQPEQSPEDNAADVTPEEPEAPKPTEEGIKARPSVRPFRSNNDLLNALKRRQESNKANKKPVERKPAPKETSTPKEYHAAEKKVHAPLAPAGPLPVKVGRKRFGSNRAVATKTTTPEPASEPQAEPQADAPEPLEESAGETLVNRPGRSRYTLSRQYKH